MSQGGSFYEFQGIGRNEEHRRRKARLVTRSACTLHKSRNTLGATYLDDSIYGTEIHPQIQARGANHHFENALMQRIFYPGPDAAIQGPVVHGHPSGPIGSDFQDFLVPHLRLGTGIGKK